MKSSNQKGSALILAMIFLLVLSVMGASLMFLSQSETWSSLNYRMMTQARYGAESGIDVAANFIMNSYTAPAASGTDLLALYDITQTPVVLAGTTTKVILSSNSAVSSTYPVSSVVTSFQNAMNTPGQVAAGNTQVNYNAVATLMTMGTVSSFGQTITVQMWQITADGSINGVRNGVEEVTAIMERQVTPAQSYAAFALGSGCGSLNFTGNATINSYDSTQLSGGVPVVGNFGGNIGSNGNLNESGNVVVDGTMSTPRTGVGNCSSGGVDAWTSSGNATVTGGLIKLPQTITFPTPTIPPPGATNVSLSGGHATQTLTPGNYGDISLSGNSTMSFQPGTYNINSLIESGGATVNLVPDPISGNYGPVIINVTGNGQTTAVDLTGGGFANQTYIAAYLTINYAGTGNINVTGGGSAAAVINAPNATANISGNGDIYGSIIANTITDTGNGTIHYDRSLSANTNVVSNYMLDSFSWTRF